MIGPKPTLEDIVLHLTPEPVPQPDLYCNEQLSDSSEDEDEDETDHHQPARPAEQQCYRIVTSCGSCGNALRLVVVTSQAEVRELQRMLMGALEIVCPNCAGRA
ncbi:transforming protein [Macaca fascicularis papillomavirus 11]|uniref:Protein E7 n=1 Tax=Macaca fascicularis papillomavirus 11 TaxID=656889 RepID=C7DY54_RHPV1|nr:transforming protein [Macaca fascicularis papillomavirus 11]